MATARRVSLRLVPRDFPGFAGENSKLGSLNARSEREPSRVGFLSCKKKKMWQTVSSGRGVNLGFTWFCVALKGSVWIRAGTAG
jgi:hypothetical protein